MSLLARLKKISTGKLLAFLDASAHPEQVVPQLVKELLSQRQALRNAEAKSLSVVRSAQRKLEETLGRALRMEHGAELALANNDELTAREALGEQIRVEASIPALRKQVANAQQILDDTRARARELNRQIDFVNERGELIRQQLNMQKLQLPVHQAPPLLQAVARMEASHDEQEIAADARREVRNHAHRHSLDERLLELETSTEVNRRLQTM